MDFRIRVRAGALRLRSWEYGRRQGSVCSVAFFISCAAWYRFDFSSSCSPSSTLVCCQVSPAYHAAHQTCSIFSRQVLHCWIQRHHECSSSKGTGGKDVLSSLGLKEEQLLQDKPLPSMIGNVSNALVVELTKFKADHHQDHNLLVELFLSRRMAKSQLILRLLFNSLLEFLQQFCSNNKKTVQLRYVHFVQCARLFMSRDPCCQDRFCAWWDLVCVQWGMVLFDNGGAYSAHSKLE